MKRRSIAIALALALAIGLVPAVGFMDDGDVPARGTPEYVIYLIDKLDVKTLDDREDVVFVRRMYDQLSAANRALVTNLADMRTAEALIQKYWILDIYTGVPAAPVDRTVAIGLWCIYEYYIDEMNAAQRAVIGEDTLAILDSMIAYQDDVLLVDYQAKYAVGKGVERQIYLMDPADPAEVSAARAAYDALGALEKTAVDNLELLKKAEGQSGAFPASIVASGGRSPSNGNGQSVAQWMYIADELKAAAPGTRTEHIWITGMLSGNGIRIGVNFDDIATDGKYAPPGHEPKTLAEWQDQFINFQATAGRPSHKEFLDYFDDNDVYVYLQVESGFADMFTLMDIYKDVFDIDNHDSVLGFAVDVEWYWGVTEDLGLPVTDKRAQGWNEYIYSTWGPEKGNILLKHYDVMHLPITYRGGETGAGYAPSNRLLYCDDAQGFGGLDGAVNGRYGSVAKSGIPAGEYGFAAEYMLFSDFYPNNKVIYQIGYANDRSWIYALDNPIKSQIIRLGDTANLNQEIGIVWVQGTFNDTLLFPGLGTNMGSFVNTMSGILTAAPNPTTATNANLVGNRFGSAAGQRGYGPILQDALYLQLLRTYYEGLTDAQKTSVTTANYNRLLELEPKALDIRIAHVLGILEDGGGYKADRDKKVILGLMRTYNLLNDDQRDEVTLLAELGYLHSLAAETVGIVAPRFLNTDLGNELEYSIEIKNVADTNMVKVEARFDLSKLDYLGCEIAIPGWEFLVGPEIDSATGLYTAVIWAGEAYTTIDAAEAVAVLTLSFEAKPGLPFRDEIGAALISANVFVYEPSTGLFDDVGARLDPHSAETTVISYLIFDLNGDGVVDMDDIATILYYYYLQKSDECAFWYDDLEVPLPDGGFATFPPASLFDYDGDGVIDMVDIIHIMSFVGL